MPGKITISDAIDDLDANGKPIEKPYTYDMADDKEVCGHGRFVSNKAAEKMIGSYVTAAETVYQVLLDCKSLLSDPQALSDADKTALAEKLDRAIEETSPENDVVAGTYGKELLLTLLSRKDCEGLRYITCKYSRKNSIVLYPVNANGVSEADIEYYRAINNDDVPAKIDMKGEVKDRPTTRAVLLERATQLLNPGFIEIFEPIKNTNYFKENVGAALLLTPDN